MTEKIDYPKHFKCRWCGCEITLNMPWVGRPQGPQCQCNPNSWGNWQRIESRTLRSMPDPTADDRAAMFERYKAQPNPLEGKEVIAVHV